MAFTNKLVDGGLTLVGTVTDSEIYPMLKDESAANKEMNWTPEENPEKFNFFYAVFLKAALGRDSAQSVSVSEEDFKVAQMGDLVEIPVKIAVTDFGGRAKSRVKAVGPLTVIQGK